MQCMEERGIYDLCAVQNGNYEQTDNVMQKGIPVWVCPFFYHRVMNCIL